MDKCLLQLEIRRASAMEQLGVLQQAVEQEGQEPQLVLHEVLQKQAHLLQAIDLGQLAGPPTPQLSDEGQEQQLKEAKVDKVTAQELMLQQVCSSGCPALEV